MVAPRAADTDTHGDIKKSLMSQSSEKAFSDSEASDDAKVVNNYRRAPTSMSDYEDDTAADNKD